MYQGEEKSKQPSVIRTVLSWALFGPSSVGVEDTRDVPLLQGSLPSSGGSSQDGQQLGCKWGRLWIPKQALYSDSTPFAV